MERLLQIVILFLFMQYDYNKNGMSDFVCTWGTQYFIRDNKLITNVLQRSMDSIFGYRNDFAWQDYVASQLANDLNINKGLIIWHPLNLHIYENHFKLIDEYLKLF